MAISYVARIRFTITTYRFVLRKRPVTPDDIVTQIMTNICLAQFLKLDNFINIDFLYS
ncbi:hypothetical protein SAMN05421881_1001110 [Nitrosomonas halophila]|uniref:Uncharacterized protein n=1 Tax=Nitrosomonas halophila TaxID=44576 RepID=A0A1H3BSX6_9PROT|nr:hypothetical protein SAMN05421881_1001110 [Nitrosomonas halophila]